MLSESSYEIDSISSRFEQPAKRKLDRSQLRSLYLQVNEKFPEAVDVFSDDGVDRDGLFATMRYLSLMTHHNNRSYTPNDHNIFF